MRLIRIEADRFGGIDGRSLGDLSPALTVVLGPNEAGKSSFTALVRHVLYGFPTPADAKEQAYVSSSGKRQARLVFGDGTGEWVVERVEGPRGGTVWVRTLAGTDRPDLVDELTRGVSRSAYRAVFGFGLAEMQQIEQLKGKDDDDLLSRLYAAGAGLTVSPPDIRADLDAAADALWAKRGTKASVNQAKTRRDEVRREIRRLQAEADAFRGESERLQALEAGLEELRARRTATRVEADRLARGVDELERLASSAAEVSSRSVQLRREAEESRHLAASIDDDPAAMAVADDIDALRSELPVFRQRLEALAEAEAGVRAVERSLAEAVADTGWTEEAALAASADAGIAASVDLARDEINTLKSRADMAAETRDRAKAESPPTGPAARAPRTSRLAIGLVAAAVAAAGVATAIALGQALAAVFAGVAAIASSVYALVDRQARVPASADGRLPAAEAACESAAAALAARTASWSEWVRAHHLGDGSEDPVAIAARLVAARAAGSAHRERMALRTTIERDAERIGTYVSRVSSIIAALPGAGTGDISPDEVSELVGGAADRVAGARQARIAKDKALAAADLLDREADEAMAARDSAEASASAVLEGLGMPHAGLDEVRARLTEAGATASDAASEFDTLLAEVSSLRARIDAERRQDTLALLRLEETGLDERIAAGVRDHAVLSVASRLLAMAQERYERDRQPEVVRNAEAAFRSMTGGRYPRLTVPLGKDAIEVFDAASASRKPEHLSRGTAEQLYLALRLGLVAQLGEVGGDLPVLMDDVLVNFSPERMRPAAEAIADLARRRQVVFFTCHPSMAALLADVEPSAGRIEMATVRPPVTPGS